MTTSFLEAADPGRLRSLPMFSDCSDVELRQILGGSAVLRREPGAVVVAEGHPGDDVFVILEGTARVTRRGEEVGTLGAGELFGEMAMLANGARTATVTATTPVELLLIDPRELTDRIGRHTIAWKMLRSFADRLLLAHELPGWDIAVDRVVAYTLGAETSERQRLITQAEVWAPMAEWLLDRIGVAAGSTVIDVACGPLGILHLLADKVGASGQVYGLDIEPRMIDLARQVAADRGVTVNFVSANAASTGLPRRAFDLVHARTLLINVVNPDELVSEMRDIAKPGGAVALQEPDAAYWVCDPPHPAWDRLLAALQTTYRLQGRDFSVGRRLGRILRDAGLESVQTHAHVFQTEAGDVYQTLLLGIIDAARPLIIEAGLYDEVGLDRLCRAARSHLERPTTTTATAMWQAWGRRSSGETAGVAAP